MKRSYILLIIFLFFLFPANGQQIGEWSFTSQGLPMYQYRGSLPFQVLDNEGNDSRLPEDPYFLLGNYRLGLFAHVSGVFQFITAQRAWARINFNEAQPNYGSNKAYVLLKRGGKSERTELVGVGSMASDPQRVKRSFGIGFARYEYDLGEGVSCTRLISVKPSDKINEGTPSFLISVTLRNDGSTPLTAEYVEGMPVNYVSMNMQLDSPLRRAMRYPVQISSGQDGRSAVAHIEACANRFLVLPSKHQRYMYDVNPPSVFMYANGDDGIDSSVKKDGDNGLESVFRLLLAPGESRTLQVVIGLVDEQIHGSVSHQVECFLQDADKANNTGVFAALWKKHLPNLSREKDEILRREMLWNAHVIEASAKYSEYYGETFIPQGSVYSYHFGDNIANRDHLQASLGACYYNPQLAKSCIRYVMKHSESDGEIKRGNSGFGYTPASIYKESDEQLYMLNAVAEYLRITGDYAFLDEEVQLYPAECGVKEKVLPLLQKFFIYLRDEVRTGPSGLVRLLNSDWADSFLHRYSPNKYEWSAESHLNTAMALAVFPKFMDCLRKSARKDVLAFAKAVEEYRVQLETAYMKDLDSRSFSARAYLTPKLRFGTDNVCIEPQAYLLQIPTLPTERKRAIYSYVKQRIADCEKIGVRNREHPLWDSKGGEDCGIWYSLEYPFLLGVATFDKVEARKLLYKFSFDNFAKHYPQYWIGHWTAPDEINSTTYREGLYSFWISIPNYRYGLQGYCSHPHTWAIYCYYKLNE
ncbi:hypothetical protein [Bacteroides timonensis]|uniref:hypothetical protein n=1 Tax=Bacteroides timonensis TaxID=1470345 RepID=UPI0004AF12E1|nr:hypothetical protein [Bacteroides timonensis]